MQHVRCLLCSWQADSATCLIWLCGILEATQLFHNAYNMYRLEHLHDYSWEPNLSAKAFYQRFSSGVLFLQPELTNAYLPTDTDSTFTPAFFRAGAMLSSLM